MSEHKVNYWSIWFYLLVMTIAEVGIVYIPMPRMMLAVILIAFALAKAILVAAYFMHLRWERKTMWIVAGAPMVFATILTIGLIPDSEKGTSASKPVIEGQE
jgi:cytochrome c oxidase subunit 4